MEPRRKHYFARIPTIALLVIFAMSPWLGIALFAAKSIDKDLEKKEQAAARGQADYTYDFRAQDTRESARATADPDYIYGHDFPTEEQKKAKNRQKTVTRLCTILGACFLLAGILDIGGAVGAAVAGEGLHAVASALAKMIGGGGALALGERMWRTRKLERQLDKIVGNRDNIQLDELFAAAGVEPAKGRAALENAIDHGYFGADAYIDNRTNILVVRGPAPQPPAPEPASEPAAPEADEDKYARLLRQLHEANLAIPDRAMNAKVARLEQISARIFALAKQDPSKEPQLRRFMDYYLPTALKLLNAYAQFAAQDIEGQNITEAKQSIERSMDLLVTAFEKQLDKLYQSDALDVSADIAALEGMMSMDGLTGSDFGDEGDKNEPSQAQVKTE